MSKILPKSDAEILAAYRERMCELDLLELATDVSDDGLGNKTYVFGGPTVKVYLTHNPYDGDTQVMLTVEGCSAPVAKASLKDCERINAVNDKRGKYLELWGKQSLVEGAYRDGKRTSGFRVHFEPEICLELFLTTE